MNRFAIVVVAAGLALSSALASQGRGQFGGEAGSAPLIPALVQPAGATQRSGGSYRSPGTEGATFELAATQSVTVIEEHYRKQLTAAGWKVESTGGDANIAYSRFTIPATGSARAGTLVVTPIESGRLWVALRLVAVGRIGGPACVSMATPVASILAEIESQITASGYKAIARTSDANQSHVRFESTQMPGSSAVVLLSVTKLRGRHRLTPVQSRPPGALNLHYQLIDALGCIDSRPLFKSCASASFATPANTGL
jgi:hypothetical protein